MSGSLEWEEMGSRCRKLLKEIAVCTRGSLDERSGNALFETTRSGYTNGWRCSVTTFEPRPLFHLEFGPTGWNSQLVRQLIAGSY